MYAAAYKRKQMMEGVMHDEEQRKDVINKAGPAHSTSFPA